MKGKSRVWAPASSTRLTYTVSFQGTRTIGSIGVLPMACSMCTRSIRSSGVCSMSITPQSKPAQPTASTTMGLADITQVPMGVRWARLLSSWVKGFIEQSFASIDRRLGRGRGALQEIQVAALMRLRHVLLVELGIAAQIRLHRRHPGGAAARQLFIVDQHMELA